MWPFASVHCDAPIRSLSELTNATDFLHLLRSSAKRPTNGAAKKRDELAPFQCIDFHRIPNRWQGMIGPLQDHDVSWWAAAFLRELAEQKAKAPAKGT